MLITGPELPLLIVQQRAQEDEKFHGAYLNFTTCATR